MVAPSQVPLPEQSTMHRLSLVQPPVHSDGQFVLPGGTGSGPQGALPPEPLEDPPLPPPLLVLPPVPLLVELTPPPPAVPPPPPALAAPPLVDEPVKLTWSSLAHPCPEAASASRPAAPISTIAPVWWIIFLSDVSECRDWWLGRLGVDRRRSSNQWA